MRSSSSSSSQRARAESGCTISNPVLTFLMQAIRQLLCGGRCSWGTPSYASFVAYSIDSSDGDVDACVQLVARGRQELVKNLQAVETLGNRMTVQLTLPDDEAWGGGTASVRLGPDPSFPAGPRTCWACAYLYRPHDVT